MGGYDEGDPEDDLPWEVDDSGRDPMEDTDPEPAEPDELAEEGIHPYDPSSELDWGLDDYEQELEWMRAENGRGERLLIETGIRGQAEDRVRRYLLLYGSAVWSRAQGSIAESSKLLPEHPSAALTKAITAAELIVRFMLVRPLLAGLVFHDALAERLASETFTGSTKRDREMLPMVCSAWDIALEELALADGSLLWPRLGGLWVLRDLVVHRGERVTRHQAEQAVACVAVLVPGLLQPLATRLGIGWPPDEWSLDGEVQDLLAGAPKLRRKKIATE